MPGRRRTSSPRSTPPAAQAIADTNDVSNATGAQALVGAAVERFGRIDVLVNNAGIIRWAGIPEADADNLEQHLAVHVGGSFNTARAAWPHLVEQGYGRIVMTTSSGHLRPAHEPLVRHRQGRGHRHDAQPRASPAASHGIKVNLIAPAATTRMAGPPSTRDRGARTWRPSTSRPWSRSWPTRTAR